MDRTLIDIDKDLDIHRDIDIYIDFHGEISIN